MRIWAGLRCHHEPVPGIREWPASGGPCPARGKGKPLAEGLPHQQTCQSKLSDARTAPCCCCLCWLLLHMSECKWLRRHKQTTISTFRSLPARTINGRDSCLCDVQVLLTKKDNTMKQYWPNAVKILCYAASCTQAARNHHQAVADAAGPRDFIDDPPLSVTHPGYWEASRHLQYLQWRNKCAAPADREENAAGSPDFTTK